MEVRSSLLSEAEKITQEVGVPLRLEKGEKTAMAAKKLVKIMAQIQQEQLMENLNSKAIHRVFMKTSKQSSRDFKLTHG